MRMDGLADVGRVRSHLDRVRNLADQIAGAGADDAAADDAVRLAVEDQLGEAFIARVGNRPPRGQPREFGDADLHAAVFRLVLGNARPGDLGLLEGYRWN